MNIRLGSKSVELVTSHSTNVFYFLPTICLTEDSSGYVELWWLRWSVGLSWPRNEGSWLHRVFTRLTRSSDLGGESNE